MSDAELKTMIAKLADTVEAERAANAKFRDAVLAELSALKTGQAVLAGRLDEQRAWLQSTDQRFTAIMAPYQQRQAS